jgi:O-antigen ligase
VVSIGIVSLAALFFTFQRTAWVAFLAVLVVLVVHFAPRMRLRLAMRSLPVLAVALVGILALNARATRSAHDPLHAAMTRLASVSDFNRDVSTRYRLAEWTAAGRAIEHHPLTGIGLGNTISFWSPRYSPMTNTNGSLTTTDYIHNSYIWFALKIGLPGAFVFVALLLIQLGRARTLLRQSLDTRSRRLLLGALATLVALLVVSLAGPHLNSDYSTPYIAAVIAFLEAAPFLLDRPGVPSGSESEIGAP